MNIFTELSRKKLLLTWQKMGASLLRCATSEVAGANGVIITVQLKALGAHLRSAGTFIISFATCLCVAAAVTNAQTVPTASARFDKVPTAGDIARVYPPEARRRDLSGMAVMQCVVGSHGELDQCVAVSETPPDAGVGAALLKLAPLFRVNLSRSDGSSAVGTSVRIPSRFNIN